MSSLNHYPLPLGRKLPSHASEGDTAYANAEITCPKCRAMLANKVKAHTDTAMQSRSSQESRFFAADASHWAGVLSQSSTSMKGVG